VEVQSPIIQKVAYSTGSKKVNITDTAASNIELRSPNGFEVCSQGSKYSNDSLLVPATVSSKNALTVTLTMSS